MVLYGATIALSAFLLFQIQPIIAKTILPWFGGSAAVWTTALMFFQLTLLAGYIYSHTTTRYLKPRAQVALHVVLLAVSLVFLPVIPSPAWRTLSGGDPTLRIVALLGATIGLPYFMLSTTGPLLQAWYASTRPGVVPYRLFAVSNAGSMLALLSFPVAVEPFLTARIQAVAWSVVYTAFVIMCATIAIGARRTSRLVGSNTDAAGEPSVWLQGLWVALSACASALLLAITTHITQNVAPVPFLWVLTLSLYLLSFILSFENDWTYSRTIFLPLLATALAGMSYATYHNYGNLGIYWALPLFTGGLFVCCMVCHGELSRLKPDPRQLTKFYLTIALGGAVGGVFVGVVAPRLFPTYLEFPISMVLCAVLAVSVAWKSMRHLPFRITAMTFLVLLSGFLVYSEIADQDHYIANLRNFYGVLRVTDRLDSGETTPARKLVNGTIIHGEQLSNPKLKHQATSYYGAESGVGRAILLFQQMQPQVHVGVIGLGAGVLASYCRSSDKFEFYEINPLDVAVAKRYFTFLPDCGGRCEVVLGDARLNLERQAPQAFDVLAVDAFSSDSIPIHLLTREAFAVYFRHLKPDGILALHVTNRYLNLVPVVARASEEMLRPAFEVSDRGYAADYMAESDWMLVGPDTHLFVLLGFHGTPIVRRGAPKSFRTWTDDFSDLYHILN